MSDKDKTMSDEMNRCVWPLGECTKQDRIEELEAELKEQALQYLSDTGQLDERIGELTEVLEAVDAWVDALAPYADFGTEPAPVFKKVKTVLGKGCK